MYIHHILKTKPHIIIVEIIDATDEDEQAGRKTQANGKIPGTNKYAQVKDFKKKKKYKFGNMEYSLESVGIRSTNLRSYMCFVNIKQKRLYV